MGDDGKIGLFFVLGFSVNSGLQSKKVKEYIVQARGLMCVDAVISMQGFLIEANRKCNA